MGSQSRQPATRLGDQDTGHPGSSPTPVITGSPDVFINGKPAARMGDKLKKHHKGERKIVEGSKSVFINGMPATRITDAVNCGGVMNEGSPNVFIGDNPMPTQPSEASLPDIVFPCETGRSSDNSLPQEPVNSFMHTSGPVILQQDQQAECMILAADKDLPFVTGTE